MITRGRAIAAVLSVLLVLGVLWAQGYSQPSAIAIGDRLAERQPISTTAPTGTRTEPSLPTPTPPATNQDCDIAVPGAEQECVPDCGGLYDTAWVFDTRHPQTVKTSPGAVGIDYSWGPDRFRPNEGRWRLEATLNLPGYDFAFLHGADGFGYLHWSVGEKSWWLDQTLSHSVQASHTPTLGVLLCRGSGEPLFSAADFVRVNSRDYPWKWVTLNGERVTL